MSTPERDYDDFDMPGCEEFYGEEPEMNLADGNANPDEEPETLDTPSADDYSYFSSMTQEDWDADNDWLASAGWGEM